MQITSVGLALIKKSESCKLAAYYCPAGVLTIGWGHTGADVFEGQTITKAEAELLLKRDVAQFERCVGDLCPKFTPSQFDAMVSLAFNIGEGWHGKKRRGERDGFRQSSVARLHNAEKYPEAQQAFALWNKAGGKVIGGLVTRRAREADRYDDDDLPTDVPDMPQAVEGEAPLSKSRTIQGSTIATAGTAITAATQILPEQAPSAPSVEPASILDSGATVLNLASEHHGLLTQFGPLLHQYWYVPMAAIALGIAYAWYARAHDRAIGRS